MRKILKSLLCLILLAGVFPYKISANNNIIQEENIYVEIEIGDPTYSEKISLYSTKKTVSNYKNYHYKNDKGQILWTVKVTGTFEYDGTTSKCISSSVSVLNINREWQVFTKNASKSGNQARGMVIMRYTPAMALHPVTVTLSCSPTGTFY